tara:strand:- start:194 stop:1540 length:1347 start_codon:yes stop_codon:yes gene_type:complete
MALFCIPPEELAGKRTVMLRHDVDHDPKAAHRMAQAEAAVGICSTYFILTGDGAARWWDHPPHRKRNLDLIVSMQEMGHEIALHYDFFGDYFVQGTEPHENATNILSAFRDAGLQITGCASHGSSALRQLVGAVGGVPYPPQLVNYRIWKECSAPGSEHSLTAGSRSLQAPYLSLADYGLNYETYWTTKDWYFSDSGGNFWYEGHTQHIMDDATHGERDPVMATALMQPGEVMQLLVHPIWWKENIGRGDRVAARAKKEEGTTVQLTSYDRKYLGSLNTPTSGFGYSASLPLSIIEAQTDLAEGSGTLVDIGCGDGVFSLALSEWYEVTGEDISLGAVMAAAARDPESRVTFVHGDSMAMTAKYDVVFMRGASFLNREIDENFVLALEKMVARAKRKLVLNIGCPPPYGRWRDKWYVHDPVQIEKVLSEYGETKVLKGGPWLTATLLL